MTSSAIVPLFGGVNHCHSGLRTGERHIPVSSSIAILLDLLRIDVGVATLCKVAGQMLGGTGSALSNALVVTVVGLVGAGHCAR